MKQSIERQIRNIKEKYPEAVILQEVYTGTKLNRPEWAKIYKAAKAGDTLIFDSVSRMSRNADEGFKVYEELFNRGVNLVFLKEPHINTETYKQALAGQLILTVATGDGKTDNLLAGIAAAVNGYLLALAKEQIRLAFEQAEKEVEDLRQRTKEGIQTARLNGKQIGMKQGTKLTTKKSIEAKKVIKQHSKAFGGTLSDKEVMKLTGLARNTFYKYKAELKEELQNEERKNGTGN